MFQAAILSRINITGTWIADLLYPILYGYIWKFMRKAFDGGNELLRFKRCIHFYYSIIVSSYVYVVLEEFTIQKSKFRWTCGCRNFVWLSFLVLVSLGALAILCRGVSVCYQQAPLTSPHKTASALNG